MSLQSLVFLRFSTAPSEGSRAAVCLIRRGAHRAPRLHDRVEGSGTGSGGSRLVLGLELFFALLLGPVGLLLSKIRVLLTRP